MEKGLLGDATPPGGAETGIFPEWSNDEALDVAFSDWQPSDAEEDSGGGLATPEAIATPEPRHKRRGRFSLGGKRGEKKPAAGQALEEVADSALEAATLDELTPDADSNMALEALLDPGTQDGTPAPGARRRGGLRKNKKVDGASARKATPTPEATGNDVAQTSTSSAVALLDDDLLPNRKR